MFLEKTIFFHGQSFFSQKKNKQFFSAKKLFFFKNNNKSAKNFQKNSTELGRLFTVFRTKNRHVLGRRVSCIQDSNSYRLYFAIFFPLPYDKKSRNNSSQKSTKMCSNKWYPPKIIMTSNKWLKNNINYTQKFFASHKKSELKCMSLTTRTFNFAGGGRGQLKF